MRVSGCPARCGLNRRVPDRGAEYERTGNVLLDRLLARLRAADLGADADVIVLHTGGWPAPFGFEDLL